MLFKFWMSHSLYRGEGNWQIKTQVSYISRRVDRLTVNDVSNNQSAFVFMVKQFSCQSTRFNVTGNLNLEKSRCENLTYRKFENYNE
jgi:hypothetical protein